MQVPLDHQTRSAIEQLAAQTGKPKETVLREVVETGLRNYQSTPTKSAQAVLDLIAWAEEHNITGQATDVSTNHNKYAWED